VFLSVQCFESRMPSYCCKHSCYVVAYLHEVVLISCIRLLLANYLLIVAEIFKIAGCLTMAQPAAKPGPRAVSGLPHSPCSSLLITCMYVCVGGLGGLCTFSQPDNLYVCVHRWSRWSVCFLTA